MKKTGIVYREICEALLKDRKAHFSERELARRLGLSPDTVSRSLAPLKRTGTAVVYRRHFEIASLEKLLAFWAVGRKFENDIAYSTYVEVKSLDDIEGRMPAEIAYTCFSAFVRIFGPAPADYGEVYAYASEHALKEIELRFPKKDFSGAVRKHNLFVLRTDAVLEKAIVESSTSNSSVPISQLYVDLWNNSSWNAYEFLKKVKERIDEIYGKAILEQ